MRDEEPRVNCPTCGRAVTRSPKQTARFYPFCSERCKVMDLADWFDGSHRIEEPLPGGHSQPQDEGQ